MPWGFLGLGGILRIAVKNRHRQQAEAEPPFEKARSNNLDLTPIQARAD